MLKIIEIRRALKYNKKITNEQTDFYVSHLLKIVI